MAFAQFCRQQLEFALGAARQFVVWGNTFPPPSANVGVADTHIERIVAHLAPGSLRRSDHAWLHTSNPGSSSAPRRQVAPGRSLCASRESRLEKGLIVEESFVRPLSITLDRETYASRGVIPRAGCRMVSYSSSAHCCTRSASAGNVHTAWCSDQSLCVISTRLSRCLRIAEQW